MCIRDWLYTVCSAPLLVVLGANAETAQATGGYLMWTVSFLSLIHI